MPTRYLPDSKISHVQNSRSNSAEYIYDYVEAEREYFAAVRELEWMLTALQKMHAVSGSLMYAIAASKQPFQITRISSDEFVLLIDRHVVYSLLTFCLRLQSLKPICNFLGLPEFESGKDYTGKFLLDITKDIVFGNDDLGSLIRHNRSLAVYQGALLFAVAHEVAHASHGHLDLMISPDFAQFQTSDDDRHLTMRALEMDADSSATTSVFAVFERVKDIWLQEGELPSGNTKESFEATLRRQYVTGLLLAHIFQDTLALNYSPKNHPIGYARFLASTNILQTVFERHYPYEADLPELSRQAIVATFISFSGDIKFLGHPIASNITMWEGDQALYLYNELGIAMGLEHLSLLHHRWSRLRPFLEPLRRGGILAPARAEPF